VLRIIQRSSAAAKRWTASTRTHFVINIALRGVRRSLFT